MGKILLDTSFVVSLFDKKDIFHSRAENLLPQIEKYEFFVTDCVINETLTVFCRRFISAKIPKIREKIKEINQALLSLPFLSAYNLLPTAHKEIVEIMMATKGNLSYHDSLLVVLMRKKRIKKIVSFDKGFDEIKDIIRIG